jgi:hypothetical protein
MVGTEQVRATVHNTVFESVHSLYSQLSVDPYKRAQFCAAVGLTLTSKSLTLAHNIYALAHCQAFVVND